MSRYQVQAPDGHTYEFEAPEGATPQQLDSMTREVAGYAKSYPVEAKPAPEPSVGKQFVDATKNDVAGIGQGLAALPDMAATAVGKVASVVPNAIGYGLDKLGNKSAADWIQTNITHPLANPFRIGDAIESVAPTPDSTAAKVARFTGQLGGGAVGMPSSAVENVAARFAGEVPKGFAPSPTQGQRVYGAAQRLGMQNKLLPADVGGAPTRISTAVSAMTLGGIPIAEQSAKGIDALAGARNTIAADAGTVRDVTGAGQAAQTGAKNWMGTTEARATGLYNKIPIAPDRPADLSHTNAMLAQLNQGLESNPELSALISDPKLKAFQAAIAGHSEDVPTGILDASGQPLTKAVQKGGSLSWKDLKAFRTYVGEKAGAPALQSDTLPKAYKALYAALSEDMGATAQAESPAALKAFNRANSFWRGRQDRIENVLNTVLGKDLNKSPNAAFTSVQGLAPTIGGDPIKLGRLMRSLSTDEADSVRATVIQRMGLARPGAQDAGGEVFSPAELLTQWSKMDPRAKSALFSKPGLMPALNDLAEVAGGMKAATKYANTSKTALGVNGAALLIQALSHPIITGAVAGTEFAIGKILSSPLLVRALVKIGRANSPGAVKAAIGRLSTIATSNAQLRQPIAALQAALNDNIPTITGAAASPGGTNPNSQQQ